MRWFRRLSLRGRLVLIGTTGLALGLAAGGVVLAAVLHMVQQNALDAGARRTAADVAGLVDVGRLGDPVPTAGTQIIQVLDDQSRVHAASIGADRLVPLLRPDELAAARGGTVVRVHGARAGLDGPLRVVAVDAGPPGGRRTVVVAAPSGDLETGVRVLRLALLVAYPVLVAALAALAWRVVGWTLRPVEALRAGAEEITGSARVAHLPVPDGDDEVHRLAVTLNGMLDRLETARQRQRAFVGDAAHELRSPLASLRTQLEVAERLDEPVAPGELLADVARLGRLVEDLLLLARADEGDPRLRRREQVELGGLLRDVAAGHAAARVSVTVTPGPAQWTDGDPDGLRRIVDNLVTNAVRHAATRVELAARAASGRSVAEPTVKRPDSGETGDTGDRVEVIVTDDGSGIPAADRERVFDRFTRLDAARARDDESPGGAGLGLAIVRELVRIHHGTVTLTDAAPGLRATVSLPGRPAPD